VPRLCESGFIQAHLEYTKNQQSPRIFHIWTAIGVVSAVLGRKIHMDRSYYKLYPNLYVVLVSPSGVGMKSTALDIGTELLETSGIERAMLKGKITSTRLVSRLAAVAASSTNGFAELLIKSREFKVFTKGVMKDSTLIEDLTDLYDCGPFDYETEHSVKAQIKMPYVTILGASTPEWLSGGGSMDMMSGGFGARIIPVTVLKDEKEIAWPQKTSLEMELQLKLVADLLDISLMDGVFYVTQGAKDFFESWYMGRKGLRKQLDSRLDGYYSKKHDMVLKVAMILSAAQSGSKTVDIIHIRMAMAVLEENEKHLINAYQGAAISPEVKYRDQVLNKLKEKKEISHSELYQYFYHGLGRKGIRELMFGLIEEKLVECDTVQTKSKPKLVYRYVGEKED
jgi:hypothetical protein